MFLYNANEGRVMSSQVVPLKQYNTQSRISREILKQCFLNLAPEMKQSDTRCAVAMTTVMPLVLFELRLKFPDFILNKDQSNGKS